VNRKGFYDAFDYTRDRFIDAFETATENYQRQEKVNPSDISKRIKNEFMKLRHYLELKQRSVTDNDIEDLFDWANDPITRENSYNPEKIDYTTHVKWIQNKLNSSDCVFLMFENAKAQKVGIVRFDRDKKKNWVISINIAPSQRGNGYSVEILKRALSYFIKNKGEAEIEAYIKKGNIASIKAFERAGFEILSNVNIKGEESILMIWK
jgi:UDP-2,4-diacetamido-2,4,6-trideoxy-beta-L-altropyranose hydrolase